MRIRTSHDISERIGELINNLEELEIAMRKGKRRVDLCEVAVIFTGPQPLKPF